MDLSDTATLMNSVSWKDRFVAEYRQLCIRISKLDAALGDVSSLAVALSQMNLSDYNNIIHLMTKQLDSMESYKFCLEQRAILLKIDLQSYQQSEQGVDDEHN